MNDPMLVGVSQRLGRITGDSERLGHGQLPLPRQSGAQGLAFDERHREPEALRGLAGVQNGQDVWVLESCGESNLAKEALRAECGSELGAQNLQGDWSIVAKIVRQIHRGHATAPELALERVATTKYLSQY
jgi:hypothetical protein